MSGEEVIACEPITGYLHRGIEKIVEGKKFISVIPYVDRLDYLSPAIQEHAYVIAIEKLLGAQATERAIFIRAIFDELTRISSHIMSIGSMTFDLGCLSLLLYGVEEREKIMSVFEETTGARMHLAYYAPGGVFCDLSESVIEKIKAFIEGIGFYLDAVEKLAINNRIFIKRTVGIGKIVAEEAIANGVSGVNVRASGNAKDVRVSAPYGAYALLGFNPIVLHEGDCHARFRLRFLEIKQSMELIKRCLGILPSGNYRNDECAKRLTIRGLPRNSVVCASTETPRGEFGIRMEVGDDSHHVHKMSFQSPSFAHVQFLRKLLVGVTIPDITAILGSVDFIMGCCDR
jgi:NADH-quinone oxidoreductase subunit D